MANAATRWSLAGLGLTLLLVIFYFSTSTSFGEPKRSFSDLGGDFSLQSSGEDISLSSFEGNVTVMYFGYLKCERVCPASLGVMSSAFKRLDESELAQVEGLFVSVDPRDEAGQLAAYAAESHPKITGAVGSEQQVADITEKYAVYFDVDSNDVDHAAQYFILDKLGKLRKSMSPTTTPNELAAQIREFL